MRRVFAMTALATVGVAGLTGCNSGGHGNSAAATTSASSASRAPNAVLAAAYSRTTSTTAKVAIDERVQLKNQGSSQDVSVHGTGVVDFAHHQVDLHLVLPQGKSELRLLHNTMYVELPQATNGKRWARIDISKLANSHGNATGLFSGDNPASIVEQLRGVSKRVDKVGTGTVGGVTTTHYRANVNLAAAAKKSGASAAQIRQLQQRLGTQSLMVDVWVDSQHRMRQLRETIPVDTANGTSGKAVVTVDLSGFGTPVHVSAPPASQVQDVTQKIASQQA